MLTLPFWRGARQTQTKSQIESKAGLASPEAWLRELFGKSVGASGIAVNPTSALTCAPVRAATRAIVETVAGLPVHVYRRGADGSKERDPSHPAYALIHDAVSDWQSAAALKEALTTDAILDKGGFAFINCVDGKPIELQRLAPGSVEVTANDFGEPVYKHRAGGKTVTIDRADILHIPGQNLAHDARDAIGLAILMERHAAKLFANGARPSGVLTYKGQSILTPEQFDQTVAIWKAAHAGDNAGGSAALPGEWEWKPLTFSSVDAQFLELRKFSIAEVSRHFGVPLTFLSELDRATYSNAAEMNQQFLTHCIMPWLLRWQGELNLKLLTAAERKTHFIEFLTDAIVKADIAARYEAYSKARTAGILSPNEIRAMENLPPYDGGDRYDNPNTTAGGAE